MKMVNLILRSGGAALALEVLSNIEDGLSYLGTDAARQIIKLHLVLSIGLAVICLPFLAWIARAATRLMPDRDGAESPPARSSALDHSTLDRPSRALPCAARSGDLLSTRLSEKPTSGT